ncbi:hypothetical protein ABE66_21705 [Cytobacillus firmus]|nr:hypothetical protein [Cytobacillus firmus]
MKCEAVWIRKSELELGFGFGQAGVRFESIFGHRRRESGDLSQNLVHLRTQKAKIRKLESEPGPSSDTEGENPEVRVRTWSIFGHRRRESGSLSQNLVHLRTQKARIRGFESEPGPSSDTEGENPGIRVRTWSIFGHRRRESGD